MRQSPEAIERIKADLTRVRNVHAEFVDRIRIKAEEGSEIHQHLYQEGLKVLAEFDKALTSAGFGLLEEARAT